MHLAFLPVNIINDSLLWQLWPSASSFWKVISKNLSFLTGHFDKGLPGMLFFFFIFLSFGVGV